MAEIVIDGISYSFEGKPKLLDFILSKNKEVPFFCYHPSMSAPANCRMCMVKVGQYVKNRETGDYELDEHGERQIRWFPKLQTSCNMDMMDDMIVHTHETDDLVKRAHKDTLEMILINHPLDCPICDQAGECPLQIQTYKYGPEGSRFEVKKQHKPKHVQLGPRVTLDAERCINCTRCTRFTDEISQSHQLTITRRGDKNHPITAPGTVFDDPYSMNTIDLCPVGALTSTDFRFKARVWEMNQTPGLDITNGKGVNVDLWTRDNVVLRITPRHNPHVNDYWMTDKGRDAIHLYNEQRLSTPAIRLHPNDNSLVMTSWDNAYQTTQEVVDSTDPKQILVLASPYASLEENGAWMQFSETILKQSPSYTPHIEKGSGDGFLLVDDQAPNTQGCELLGLKKQTKEAFQKTVAEAQVILSVHDDYIERGWLSEEDIKGKTWIYFGTNDTHMAKVATLTIPITSAVEHTASYINVDQRIQRTYPAKETKYTNRRLDLEMSEGRLDRFGTKFDHWVNEDNKVDCKPLWEIASDLSSLWDGVLSYRHGREVLESLVAQHPTLQGVSYQDMDDQRGIQLSTSGQMETSA
jgi:NADH-quinone oxidoreductase subunit G